MANYDQIFITRKGYKDYLTLRIYKTHKAMLAGSKKLDALYKYDYNPLAENGAAFFIATPVQKCKNTNSELTADMYGIILLNEEYLLYDLIAHECLHAALAHERLINRYMLDYYHEEHDEEERIAYYFQWLYANILYALKDSGYKIQFTKISKEDKNV